MIAAGTARHRLRGIAERCGLRATLGGPLPHGRRVEALLSEGRVIGERDVSARWRGRLLIAETRAELQLTGAARERVEELARDAGWTSCRAELVLGEEGASLLALLPEESSRLVVPAKGVLLEAFVTAGEPAGTTAEIDGRATGLALPAGCACALALGDEARLAAGAPLATIAARGADRVAAVSALRAALDAARIDGIATNLHLLRRVAASEAFARSLRSARELDALSYAPPLIEVLRPGTHSTIQDWPGRLGHWRVGVPPSGPMDDLAWRLANRLVGNPPEAAGLELTLVGPTLRFHADAIVCLAGAPVEATLDGRPLPAWRAVAVPAGAVLRLGTIAGPGCRACLAIRHGLDVPAFLGSRATFDLGGFGGHAGRALRAGDWLPLPCPTPASELAACPAPLRVSARPAYSRSWEIGVLEGPHAAPDFFTAEDMAALYATAWEVHHNSSRTGVRLIGPAPRWARRDGGDAGLHPSNIHDNAYAIGAIDFTGDMPILLGPDGPSLGGFVCPAVVVSAERWKLGQLRPGDRVRFRRVSPAEARALHETQERQVAELARPPRIALPARGDAGRAVLARVPPGRARPALCLRRSGDRYVLAEYGEPALDLALRLRAHLLMQALERLREPGMIDLTPGIRSLQVHHDPRLLTTPRLVELLLELDAELPPIDEVEIPARTVHLPLSWDDPATRLAIERYARTVRADAPWCPSNIEFIRRINGLETVERVREIVHEAAYLVLGLGDVYLGAPVATPLDPRHRLVTTKYNPARTWTPQNAVGIGGAYLCVYGMEGPGGYQFVGRTVPVWSAWRPWRHERGRAPADGSHPWLLRFFDRIRFHPVSAEELLELRREVAAGRAELRVEDSVFSWREHRRLLETQAGPIAEFRQRQQTAFAEERARWEAARGDSR